jgi:serine/threonine protein kinase
VYKASCIATQTKVIIKAYHKPKMQPKHHHKLQREISAMRALNGPYVAELFSTFEVGGAQPQQPPPQQPPQQQQQQQE